MIKQKTIDDVYEVILLLGKEAERIPESVVKFFKANATKPFKSSIDLSKKLEEQNFSYDTCAVLKYISGYLK